MARREEDVDLRLYMGSDWLKSRDLDRGRDYEVTITGWREGKAGGENGGPQDTVIGLELEGFDKAMIVNVTNGTTLHDLFDTWDPRDMVGKRIVIYQDPTVTAPGGQLTGGVRIRPTLPKSKRARRGGRSR